MAKQLYTLILIITTASHALLFVVLRQSPVTADSDVLPSAFVMIKARRYVVKNSKVKV